MNGSLSVPVYTTATPYQTVSVSAPGYVTYSSSITQFPGNGETISLYATLNPRPTSIPTTVPTTVVPTTAVIGGNQGWYTVNCNVNGASVYFDGKYMGSITSGSLSVRVYTTGTPYQTFSVSAPGYVTYTSTITRFPGNGETVSLYATLNAQPTTVPTTILPVVIGGNQGWYKVNCNVDGASVYFDNAFMGNITGGSLSVRVYTTGTPYQTFSVSAPGYVTYTSTITQFPGNGETVSLYATLNAQPTTVPTTLPTAAHTTKSPFPPEMAGAAVVIGALGISISGRKKP